MSKKLLIVDDSKIIRRSIQRYAEEAGLEVVGMAANGRDAIAEAGELQPEFITLDLTMPEMDGFECLSELRRVSPNSKIIVVTALRSESTSIEVLSAGAVSIIQKPFSKETILETFKSHSASEALQ